MAIRDDDVARLQRAAVIGRDGTALGTVNGIYFDNATDQPAWAAVRSGGYTSLVPLATASLRGTELHVPFDPQQLEHAPHHDPGRALSPQDEIDLFRHYGVEYDDQTEAAPAVDAGSGADDAMTRSEEHLRVRTEAEPVERVRLRKHVVTEYQQVTVPVRREEVRLERVPVGEGEAPVGEGEAPVDDAAVSGDTDVVGEAASGPADDDEQVIVLYEERPVVRTETVPVERVRMGKRTVVDQETVGGDVRREEIEVDVDPEVGGPR
jgi:stress response protein YsnF